MKNPIVFAVIVLAPVLMLTPSHSFSQEPSEGSRKVVTKVVPQYPSLARAMNIQGNVRADVLVAPNGKVKSIEVKGGHPLLAQAAQDALRLWKWEPAPRETHEIVELKFTP
ncbi:MAG: energy transducer TonB [Candidatus Sulfotelmatobacter sp.]